MDRYNCWAIENKGFDTIWPGFFLATKCFSQQKLVCKREHASPRTTTNTNSASYCQDKCTNPHAHTWQHRGRKVLDGSSRNIFSASLQVTNMLLCLCAYEICCCAKKANELWIDWVLFTHISHFLKHWNIAKGYFWTCTKWVNTLNGQNYRTSVLQIHHASPQQRFN